MSDLKCTVCGFKDARDQAHVRDRYEFDEGDEHRLQNIIPLCPNHHRMFDSGKIGICPSRDHFVILTDGGIDVVEPVNPIHNIRDEYIQDSNSKTVPRVKVAIGLVPSQLHASHCPEHQRE